MDSIIIPNKVVDDACKLKKNLIF